MLGRFWDSDLAYSFRTSPVAVVSALVALILVIAAAFAPWLAPHDPMDVASLSLLDSFKPPLGMSLGDATRILQAVRERKQKGLASVAQVKLLAKFGCDARQLSIPRAGKRITALKDAGFKPGAFQAALASIVAAEQQTRGERT